MEKGRIQEELGKFLDIFKFRLNRIMNWGEKLRKLAFLEIKLQDKSMKSKITQFLLVFAKKSRSKIKREILITKREKLIEIHKIKLIYALKLKSKL